MKENELKLGAILSYVTLVLSNIIGILYTPIMLRMMGQSEYGLYSLISSTVGYLTILDVGLGNAAIRYICKYRAINDYEGEYKLNGMFLILYSIISVISIILGIILLKNVENLFISSLSSVEINKAKIMIVLLVLNISLSFPLSLFGSIMIAYEKFVFSKIINIARIIINPCIMIPLLIMGYKSVAMVLVTTILNIICLLINMWYCLIKLKVKIKFNGFERDILKEIFIYSFYIFLNIIIDKIYWSTDQFILGMVSSTSTIAIYSIASQLSMYYMNFSTALSSVLLPKITIMVSENASSDELSEVFIKVGRIQYIIMGLILTGFILFGKQFILLWAGEGYNDAFYMALVIMIPLTIPLIQTIGLTVLQAKNKHKFRSVLYLIISIINIYFSLKLGKIIGGFGCALVTGISILIGHFIIMNIYYHKVIRLRIIEYWENILNLSIPIIISAVIGLIINCIIPTRSNITYFLEILFYTIVYFIFIWKLGMNSYEKKIFLELSKIKKYARFKCKEVIE